MATAVPVELDFDPYEVLGLDSKATKEGISKVARKLALRYHPDKNTDADAPALFLRVQKAKEFLLDEVKRKEYDDGRAAVLKRKEYEDERSSAMDGKRKRFREDLEAKLQQELSASQTVRQQKQAPAPVARQENATRMEQQFFQSRDSKGVASTSLNQVEVIGNPSSRGGKNNTEESIFLTFKVFGSIEDVSLVEASKTVITFTSASSARAAVEAYAASEEFSVTLIRPGGGARTSKGAILGPGLSSIPQAFMKDVQRLAAKIDMEKRLAAASSFAASVITMEDLAIREANVLQRIAEAALKLKEARVV